MLTTAVINQSFLCILRRRCSSLCAEHLTRYWNQLVCGCGLRYFALFLIDLETVL
jgi:hypothetical protein